MPISENIKKTYIDILEEELVPAMGCTEPIAIAYSSSILTKVLGGAPESIKIGLSGNIIKNVKSVIVPATGGLHGISAAVSAGVISGSPEKQLQVLSALKESDRKLIKEYSEKTKIDVYELQTEKAFEIHIEGLYAFHSAKIVLADRHTNVTSVVLDSCDLTENYLTKEDVHIVDKADRSLLNVKDIIDFADEIDLSRLSQLILRQIGMNMAISEEGLKNSYGASIGKLLYESAGESTRNAARAYAAAGSDARMNGCELPVSIISGSGNQGITACVPVVIYGRAMGCTDEQIMRAVIVSDLITIHQKTGIGCLSAYCGAISAGCGCGCGICYLGGGRYYEIAHTLVNSLAILSGTICDGAKASCAAKIAMAVEAGIMGCEMAKTGRQFYGGDGIVTKGVENTVKNVGRLARDGMSETDKEIIRIMLESNKKA